MSTQASTPPRVDPGPAFAPARQAKPLRTETSWAADLPFTGAAMAWRARWQLAPLAGAGGVFACGVTQGLPLATPLLAGGIAAGAAWRWGKPIAGRMWLSGRERGHAAAWLGTAGVWSLAHPLIAQGQPGISGAVLASALAYPSLQWARSRRPKGGKAKLSQATRLLVAKWPEQIAVTGPEPLRQSCVDRATLTEPVPGAAAFEVTLRHGVHGQTAAAEAVRLQVEADLHLPLGTLRVIAVHSDRVQVLITPTRHLASTVVEYRGPEWDNGRTMIGRSEDGKDVQALLADADGVLHRLVSGTSGTGKSRAFRPLILPWVAHGHGVLVLLDGGRGTSCPDLAPAAKVYAVTPDEWRRAIRGVYAVFELRATRRGLAGLTRFRAGADVDKAIILALDEGGFVTKALSAVEEEMVLAMKQQGRKLGIAVYEAVQDAMGDEIAGGRKGRDLLGAAGGVIALRAGGSQAARLTIDSTSASVDLTALPDAPGAAWAIERGQVLTGHPIRIVNCDEEASAAITANVTVQALCDEEEAALRQEMTVALTAPEETAEEVEESDRVLLEILAAGPKQLGDIVADEGTVQDDRWKWSRRTAARSFGRLEQAGKVEKVGKRYAVVSS